MPLQIRTVKPAMAEDKDCNNDKSSIQIVYIIVLTSLEMTFVP